MSKFGSPTVGGGAGAGVSSSMPSMKFGFREGLVEEDAEAEEDEEAAGK